MSTPAIPAINSATAAATAASTASQAPIQQLSQKDFIQLLVAQMTTQDPLNPQKDTEFISQMAQFSTLQSTNSMQTELQSMSANQLLGQTVQIKVDATHTLVGQVTAIDSSGSDPKLIVGGQAYSVSDVIRVQQATSAYAPA